MILRRAFYILLLGLGATTLFSTIAIFVFEIRGEPPAVAVRVWIVLGAVFSILAFAEILRPFLRDLKDVRSFLDSHEPGEPTSELIREWHVKRAIRALERLEDEESRPTWEKEDILDNEAGARWMEEYCGGDPVFVERVLGERAIRKVEKRRFIRVR